MPRVTKRHVLSGIKVKEAMRRQVIKLPQSAPVDYCINRTTCLEIDSLVTVIDKLIEHRCGAVLIADAENKAVGVVSKSDLIVAYKHDVTVDVSARKVMSTPVRSCNAEAELSEAIQLMLLKDVQRIFIHTADPTQITGVLSLSDAARFRSGSCRACTSSRIIG